MKTINTTNNKNYQAPLFLPVFEYGNEFISMDKLKKHFPVQGIITNAFFLYKNRRLKEQVLKKGIKKFLDFGGLVVTDSGAFQGFSRPLYLSNKTIIKFQQDIGADIISPLDLVSPPGEKKVIAQKKLTSTLKRIKEGLTIADKSVLIGVQQGSNYLDLRLESIKALKNMDCKYIALGSLVPFFNKNHSLEFVGKMIQQARQHVPWQTPVHLYGAGDPVELPFYIMLGCDVFDSSSFIHYAKDGWYMTPYGALTQYRVGSLTDYRCNCPYCKQGIATLYQDKQLLTCHNLWVIYNVVQNVSNLKNNFSLSSYLDGVIKIHQKWFPKSDLEKTWYTFKNTYQTIEEILKSETQTIIGHYRLDKDEVAAKLEEKLHLDINFFKLIQGSDNFTQLSRRGEYKNFIKSVRKNIYYQLRQYHRQRGEENQDVIRLKKSVHQNPHSLETQQLIKKLCKEHTSTQERQPFLKSFNQQLLKFATKTTSILDVGCGIYPLSFPFNKMVNLKDYTCIDKDKLCFKVIKSFSQTPDNVNLKFFNHRIGGYAWDYYLPKNVRVSDLVLMIKLIPVISRQEPSLLNTLANVPANKILITASKESMTKRQDITKRQDQALRQFIELISKKIVDKIEINNEFGYLIS